MAGLETTGLKWQAVIERARALDPDAFDAIVEEFAPRVRGFLRRFVPVSELDDLLQELFLRMVRTIATYRDDGRFEAWVFQIARNLAVDHLRKTRGGMASIDGSDSAQFAGETAEDRDEAESGIEHGETMNRIEAALVQLPEAEREVILLRHFGRLSFEEIARMMNTPLGTALARAHRGLARLRSSVDDQR